MSEFLERKLCPKVCDLILIHHMSIVVSAMEPIEAPPCGGKYMWVYSIVLGVLNEEWFFFSKA